MWSSKCQGVQLEASSACNVVRHKCDSTYGQSGSPMYSANMHVRAILTVGNSHGLNWGIQVSSRQDANLPASHLSSPVGRTCCLKQI